jgi:hypothetical protein
MNEYPPPLGSRCGAAITMNKNIHFATAATLLFAAAAPAQLAKGSPAPAFEIAKVWNDGPAKFDEFEGKLVILDFAQTW